MHPCPPLVSRNSINPNPCTALHRYTKFSDQPGQLSKAHHITVPSKGLGPGRMSRQLSLCSAHLAAHHRRHPNQVPANQSAAHPCCLPRIGLRGEIRDCHWLVGLLCSCVLPLSRFLCWFGQHGQSLGRGFRGGGSEVADCGSADRCCSRANHHCANQQCL